jgi:hypothetical protein
MDSNANGHANSNPNTDIDLDIGTNGYDCCSVNCHSDYDSNADRNGT